MCVSACSQTRLLCRVIETKLTQQKGREGMEIKQVKKEQEGREEIKIEGGGHNDVHGASLLVCV